MPDFSKQVTPRTPGWHKSNRCAAMSECVEVRFGGSHIDVRNSKDPHGPVLTFTYAEWYAFLGGARDGEFDLPRAA